LDIYFYALKVMQKYVIEKDFQINTKHVVLQRNNRCKFRLRLLDANVSCFVTKEMYTVNHHILAL
jgi:hypothetical protein